MKQGVSGLRAEGEALGVVADNVANVNTAGFKRQRSLFEDTLLRSGGSGAQGAGVRQSAVQQIFNQGTLSQTGMPTDLAINGEGFFVVTGSVNGMTGSFYSRAGQFRLNASGSLVDPAGMKLCGRAMRSDGTLAAEVAPLVVPTANIPAHATSAVQLAANLDASDPVSSLPFDPQTPDESANASTSVQVFDTLGNAHALDIYFVKTADGPWDYHALVAGETLDPPVPGARVEVGAGTLTFTSNGALDTVSTSAAVSVSFAGATSNQNLSLDFGTPISAGGTGLDGTTQFSMPSSTSAISQDGYPSGALSGVSVNGDGSVEGLYTNGMRLSVGQVALAKFRSTDGLARAGNSLWIATAQSGEPALGAPASGGRGALSSGALEGSNIDLGEEFVSMITHQRAYSADSKVITTADEMLTTLMQIKQ
jgi:flagellar hook protein FlgE